MENDPQKKATAPLPDFGSLYNRAVDTLKTSDSPNLPPSGPEKTDGIPDFSSIYTQPKSIRDQNIEGINRLKNEAYDAIGLKPGALRGFIDMIPSALTSAFGTEPSDVGNAVGAAGRGLADMAGQLVEHPLDTSANLAKMSLEGIAKPFLQYPIELIANKQISMSEDLTQLGSNTSVLTPEERQQRAKGIGANIVAWALGIKAEEAVAKGMIGQEAIAGGKGLKAISEAVDNAARAGVINETRVAGDIIDEAFSTMSTRQLVQLRDAAIAPEFMRTLAGGTAGGAIGGFTTGYLEGETSSQRLEAGLSYALVAMPIGVAMTSSAALFKLGKPIGDMPDMIAQQAGHIAKMRQLSAFGDLTPAELLFNLNNLQETQSMAATLALRDLEYTIVGQSKDGTPMQYGKNASVIPAVENPADMMRIIAEHNSNADNAPAIGVLHTRKDGTHDFLVSPSDMPKAEQDFFAKTGFVHGQQVSYGGRENWVIEKQGVPDGKRSYRMELRDLVTDERVQDVKPSDIARLGSREPGDIALHLGRLVTPADIYEPAQGFVAEGKNSVPPRDVGENISRWHMSVRNQLEASTGLANIEFAEGKVWMDGEPLVPGIHKFEVPNTEIKWLQASLGAPDTPRDGKRGVVLHVGGEMVDQIGPDGKPVKVMVGIPGEVTAVLDWNDELGYNNKMQRGSQNFFSYMDAPNRHLATEAIKKERIAMGLDRSFSSLSEGGAKSLASALNFYGRDRQVRGTMTVYTPEVLKTRLIEDFLDHVGATPDGRFMITPEENITMIGWQQSNPFNNPTVKPKQTMALPGSSRETVLNRLAHEKLRELEGNGFARMYTESKKPLTLKESVALIREQLSNDAVPTVRTQMDRAIDRTELSFNDLVNSFTVAHGIRPEVAPAVRSFLEAQIGRELLGMDGVRSRLVDRTSIPVLEGELARAQKTAEILQKKMETHQTLGDVNTTEFASITERLKTNREVVDAFTARIKQLKEAGPLPFSEEERGVYSRLVTEAQSLRKENVNDLVATAQGNGFVVEREEGGIITLRDAQTWERLPNRFAEPDAARDFINATGKAKGIDLDGGGNNMVPPSSVAGSAMLPPEPQPRLYEVPHQFAPNSTVSKVMQYLDTVAPWFTPKRAFMIALDGSFKTKFYDDVYLPLQTAKMKLEAMKRPFLTKLKEVEDLLVGNKIDRERWQVISQYRESMSPQEIVDNLYKDRKLTQTEIGYAQKLVDDNIDIQKAFSYRRAVMELDKGFKTQLAELQREQALTQDPMALSQINLEIKKLGESHDADIEGAKSAFIMDGKHLKAVDMLNEVAAAPINEASLHGVTRLARAIQNGETDRAGFAATHKLTGPEIAAAKKLDELYSSTARQLGIDERITNYFNHFRTYTNLPDATPARLRTATLRGTIDELPGIAADMIRSGEMNIYELDPIKAAMQYINTGFSHRHFNETWKAARNSAVEHLQQITQGREAAARVINEYVGGMKGAPSASDELGQLAFDKFLSSMGYEPKLEVKTDIISTFLAATSGAFLGFRPAQGVRDFAQFSKIYYSRFGASRWKNGLDLAFKRDEKGTLMLNKLAEDGTVPGLSVLQFASEAELASGLSGAPGKIKDAIFDASAKGLAVSGQHNAYALAHAIAYLDTRDLAKNALLDLSRGKMTKEAAYKKLSMNSYDLPVAEGFDRLVTDGKFDQAAEYLAQATGTETAFVFGIQNHPYGWGTAVGKLAGQFGTWAVWTRNYLTRLAGRGTAGERAAAMARFASAEVATGLAGRALGFNMRSWYMLPGIIFMGGPAFDYAQQIEDMAGVRGRMRQDMATKQMTRGPVPVIGQVLPGSSALNDYLKAYQLSQQRYGPIPILGKALGFSVDQSQRSWADELQGNYPQLSGR